MRTLIKEFLQEHRWSERRLCKTLEVSRPTQRYLRKQKNDETLVERITYWALRFKRAGYRTILDLLRDQDSIVVNHKKLERLWDETGLKIRKKKKKHRWFQGEPIRIRPERRNQVWSYDIVTWKLFRGGKIRILNVLDELSRECLGVLVKRSIKATDVEGLLANLFIQRGRPEYLRSDNGAEFTARSLMKWLTELKVGTLFIDPGSPWQNGFVESFNGKMREECLNLNVCGTLMEADYVVKQWVKEYNTIRPHSSLGGRPPAPEAIRPNFFFGRANSCLSLN
jgi:transposase InsO family protein